MVHSIQSKTVAREWTHHTVARCWLRTYGMMWALSRGAYRVPRTRRKRGKGGVREGGRKGEVE